MRTIAVALCLLVFRWPYGYGQTEKPPRFEDYPARNIHRGKVRAPSFGDISKFTGTDVRCFGAEPGFYTKKPVNFAGHYVIGACTCGSSCHYLYLWDALTGKVYQQFPAQPIDVGPYRDGSNDAMVEYKGEEYHVGSSLLIVEGCVEQTCDCARRYYRWDGKAFKLLLRQSVPMPTECKK